MLTADRRHKYLSARAWDAARCQVTVYALTGVCPLRGQAEQHSRPRARLYPHERARIARLAESGLPEAEIARVVGRDQATVRSVLARVKAVREED